MSTSQFNNPYDAVKTQEDLDKLYKSLWNRTVETQNEEVVIHANFAVLLEKVQEKYETPNNCLLLSIDTTTDCLAMVYMLMLGYKQVDELIAVLHKARSIWHSATITT